MCHPSKAPNSWWWLCQQVGVDGRIVPFVELIEGSDLHELYKKISDSHIRLEEAEKKCPSQCRQTPDPSSLTDTGPGAAPAGEPSNHILDPLRQTDGICGERV